MIPVSETGGITGPGGGSGGGAGGAVPPPQPPPQPATALAKTNATSSLLDFSRRKPVRGRQGNRRVSLAERGGAGVGCRLDEDAVSGVGAGRLTLHFSKANRVRAR